MGSVNRKPRHCVIDVLVVIVVLNIVIHVWIIYLCSEAVEYY